MFNDKFRVRAGCTMEGYYDSNVGSEIFTYCCAGGGVSMGQGDCGIDHNTWWQIGYEAIVALGSLLF
jgi:hypothetical protein